MAYSLDNRKETMPEFIKGYKKYKETLDKEIKGCVTNGLIGPGEQPLYDLTLTTFNEYIKTTDFEIDLIKQGKGHEALKNYDTIGRNSLYKFAEAIAAETKFNSDGAINSTKQGASLTTITNWSMLAVIILSITVSCIIALIIMKLTTAIKIAIEGLKVQGDNTMKISKTLMHSSQSLSESVTEQAASVTKQLLL